MAVSPRKVALMAIEKTKSGIHIQNALNSMLVKMPLSQKDAALCTDLVYGFFRAYLRIEYILAQVLPKPQGLPSRMHIYLAMGVYSMCLQDKVPDYAAVDQTVRLVRKEFGQRMGNVANGALRSIQKMMPDIDDPEWYMEKSNPDKWSCLSIFHGMPRYITDIWLNNYGPDATLLLLKRSFARPWQGLRVNRAHDLAKNIYNSLIKKQNQQCQAVGAYGFAFAPGMFPQEIAGHSVWDLLQKGALSMQAAGSMQILQELQLTDLSNPVWDCCAGSGGKTGALAEASVDISLATDTSLQRLNRLKAEFTRLELTCPLVAQADMTKPPLPKWHGDIVMDVPCSGLGVLGRRPDIRFSLMHNKKYFEKLPALQQNMLSTGCSLLQKGRKLAYITCTLNPDENEKMLAKILARDIEIVCEWQTPHESCWLEGMYGAVLQKI